MFKKLINTLKTVLVVLACILVPLITSLYFVRVAFQNDATKCVNTFLTGETIDLSKYISLQFAHAPRDVDIVAQKVRSKILANEKSDDSETKLQKDIEQIAKETPNAVMINLFDEYGELLFSSLGEDDERVPAEVDIPDTTRKDIASKIFYSLDKLDNENEDVVVRYAKIITVPKKANKPLQKTKKQNDNKKGADKKTANNNSKSAKKTAKDKNKISNKNTSKQSQNNKEEVREFFVEIVLKWSDYESYMENIQEGVFPRMFYIVSPDASKYLSNRSLPAEMKNSREPVALGQHLLKELGSLPNGMSVFRPESHTFLIYKEEIKMPENMVGHNFFVIEAADNSTIKGPLKEFDSRFILMICILIVIWSVACWYLIKFYNSLKEKLDVSTTISTSTPLAITIFRISDGKIVQINSAALSLFRIKKEAVDTIDFWKMFMYEDDRHYISNAITADVNILNYEVLAQSFGGSTFWIVCSANHITIREQSCVIFAALDVNQRKEMERKLANNAAILEQEIKDRTNDLEVKAKELETSNALLEKSRKVADEANAAKTKFLTNMSNELKTPINAIVGYSEILEEEARDRKDTVTADDLHKIISSAKHLLSLIDEILDLSSIESGKVQLFFQNTRILSLLKDVESVVMPLVTENDNSFFMEASKGIGEMYIDSTKLRQCLLNLLSNAAKYTQFGKVTLRVNPAMKNGVEFVEFVVIDTGAGIDPDRLPHIFETLHDEDGASIGAGLGLSLTKKYAEVMGGSVAAESELGNGSKFILTLPRKCTVESSDSVIVKNNADKDEVFEKNKDTLETFGDVGFADAINKENDEEDDLLLDDEDEGDEEDLLDPDGLFEDGSKKTNNESKNGAEEDLDLDDEFNKALKEDDGSEELEDIDGDEDLGDDIDEDLIEDDENGENLDSRFTGNTGSASKYSLSTPEGGEKKKKGDAFGRKSDL